MTQTNVTRLRSTLSAIIAFLIAFSPDILEVCSVTDASPKWARLATKVVGLVVGLATSGRAVLLLNKFLPSEKPTVTKE